MDGIDGAVRNPAAPAGLHLRIVTPAGEFLSERVEMVELNTSSGQIGVLPGHVHLVTPLEIGPIGARAEDRWRWWFSGGGFATIEPGHVSVLAIGLVAHVDHEVLEACCERARSLFGETLDEAAMAAACSRARDRLATMPPFTAATGDPEFDIPRAAILSELLKRKTHH
jgi:F-type H+-transporting ATPase subunit epsilon